MRAGGLREIPVRGWFNGMDQVWKLYGVLNEEHWRVIAHQIPVTFIGIELDGKTPNVAGEIG